MTLKYNKIQNLKRYEFGYYTFDTLPTLEVSNVETTQDVSVHVNDESNANNSPIELPIDNNILFELQQKDTFCANILAQIEKGNIIGRTIIHYSEQTVKKVCYRW